MDQENIDFLPFEVYYFIYMTVTIQGSDTMKGTPELLAPAGSYETLVSAIQGGADAVYLGGKLFNARMNAKNFDSDGLKKAVSLCHEKGVKIYVTLNTLIYDKNFNAALKYAEELYNAGVDALITADIGFSECLHRYIPDFELHASTQMSGHNLASAEYLAKRGFSRMVCAREMSKENIEYLVANSPIEIEMFIHGAMCVCQSGQCLMSSFIGGRSGNRGECAQPCRLPYNRNYPLSLKDMCLASHVKELIKSGVCSLKIEGRMKSPSYVYSVTSTYRRLLDENRNATQKEIDRLGDVFSRSGFSDGYYTGKVDNSMLGVRSTSDKEATKNTFVKQIDVKRNRSTICLPERNFVLPDKIELDFEKNVSKKTRSARFYDPKTIPDGSFFDVIYLPLEKFFKGKANGIILPPIIYDSDVERIENLLKKAKENGALHCLVGNIGHIELAEKHGFILHGDYRLNVYNNSTCKAFSNMESVILSPELTLAQIRDIGYKKSAVVYGRIPLMTLEKPTGQKVLRDRRGVIFPILREGGKDIVLNSVPIYMGDKQDALKKSGIFDTHFIFTTESADEVRSVIKSYISGKTATGNVKRIK